MFAALARSITLIMLSPLEESLACNRKRHQRATTLPPRASSIGKWPPRNPSKFGDLEMLLPLI